MMGRRPLTPVWLLALTLASCADAGPGRSDLTPLAPAASLSNHANSEHPEAYVLHRTLVRWYSGSGHMTSSDPTLQPAGYTSALPLFYVPAEPVDGTQPIYRLHRGGQHMDSRVAGEGGYETLGTLGHAYTSRISGTEPIRRFQSRLLRGHVTAHADEAPHDIAFRADPHAPGHGSFLGYGFPRPHPDFDHPSNQLVVPAHELTLVANRMVGGAVTKLGWNGRQFVNNYDFGRQIQQAVFLPGTDPGSDEGDAPTEAGDEQGWGAWMRRNHTHRASVPWAHGSPMIRSEIESGTLRTTTHPLAWKPAYYNNRDGSVAAVWKGTMSKEVEVDDPVPNVVRWSSRITFPARYSYAEWEALTHYLVPAFDQAYLLDAPSGHVTDRSAASHNRCYDTRDDPGALPESGGAISVSYDRRYAVGTYRRSLRGFYMKICKRGVSHDVWDEFSPRATNVSLFRHLEPASGTHEVTAYLVVGTFIQVQELMKKLYREGY